MDLLSSKNPDELSNEDYVQRVEKKSVKRIHNRKTSNEYNVYINDQVAAIDYFSR